MIESKYQPHLSSSGPGSPAELWQITRETAKNFGLSISGTQDERKDVQTSSEAVFKYLQTLHKMFNDWGLVLLAYNTGEGTIQKLMETTGSDDAWILAQSPSAPSLTPLFNCIQCLCDYYAKSHFN